MCSCNLVLFYSPIKYNNSSHGITKARLTARSTRRARSARSIRAARCAWAASTTRSTVARSARSTVGTASATRSTVAGSARAAWAAATLGPVARIVHVGASWKATDLVAANGRRSFAHRDELELARVLGWRAAGVRFGHTARPAHAFAARTIVLEAVATRAIAVSIQDAATQFAAATASGSARRTARSTVTWATAAARSRSILKEQAEQTEANSNKYTMNEYDDFSLVWCLMST